MDEVAKPESKFSITNEAGAMKNYFTLQSWQLLVILGIALSGLSTFVTTYNAWSGINTNVQACAQSSLLQKKLKTKFIVILVLSCLAVVLGILLAWFLRRNPNPRKLFTLGITGVGVFGIIYAIALKFQNVTDKVKLGVSWASFVAFLLLGFFLSYGGVTVGGVKYSMETSETTE